MIKMKTIITTTKSINSCGGKYTSLRHNGVEVARATEHGDNKWLLKDHSIHGSIILGSLEECKIDVARTIDLHKICPPANLTLEQAQAAFRRAVVNTMAKTA